MTEAYETVDIKAVVNKNGTFDLCPYCHHGLLIDVDTARIGDLIIRCSTRGGCSAEWTVHPSMREDLLDQLYTDVIDLNRVPFIKVILNPIPYEHLLSHYFRNNQWTKQFMEAKGWVWICVCGGRVIKGSSGLPDFPSWEEKLNIAMENGGFIPICLTNLDIVPGQF